MRKSIIIVVVVKFLYASTMQKIISKIKYRAFVWKKIGRFTWKATGVNSIPIDLVLDSSNLFLAAPPMLLFFFGKPIKRDTSTLVSLPSAPNGRNEPKIKEEDSDELSPDFPTLLFERGNEEIFSTRAITSCFQI